MQPQSIEPLDTAGFWIRFVAKVIDGLLVYLLQLPVLFVLEPSARGPSDPTVIFDPARAVAMLVASLPAAGLSMLLGIAYTVFFNGRFGATLGKMALKLEIVRPDGSAIDYGVALGRYLAEILSSLFCLIGYIMAGFDEQHRALHDRLARTRVVRSK